jgi:pullulanase
MKKISLALFSIFSLVFTATPVIAAPETVTLTVHYQRPGGDYNGWNLWIWKNSDNNSLDAPISQTGVQFTGDDDFGKSVTVKIEGMKNFKDVGIIVRLNDWSAKDIDIDRFVTQFDENGRAEIWLVQNDKNIYTQKPKIDLKISRASFDSLNEVRVELNRGLKLVSGSTNGFSITGGLEIIDVRPDNPNRPEDIELILTLKTKISLNQKYRISHPTYGQADVILGKLMTSPEFEKLFTYTGNDLGPTYQKTQTTFRLWAPTATKIDLITFSTATSDVKNRYEMKPDLQGTWTFTLNGDQDGLIYAYSVEVYGEVNEVIDPYVKSSTANGKRGVVIDLTSTNPKDWRIAKPKFSGKPTDAVIYELHVRDLSMDESAPFPLASRGKFSGLTFSKLKGASGQPVGVNAIKDLGITHVQLLPIYDFASVDELSPTFNWGYDPLNYNVPEGSYSSDPNNPKARITELKQAIQSLHDQGIRVMMDVVYNHVYDAKSFSQNKIIPGYWFRTDSNGNLTSASGCGNDSASERSMVRKFIVDSVTYWAKEYNLSGFRFDLMGLHDIETMQEVRSAVNKIDPSIIIIGEGWNMGTHPAEIRANQLNIRKLPGVGVFNDQIRDGIKGSVFDSKEKGYVTGNFVKKPNVQAGIVGNIAFSSSVYGSFTTVSTSQSVNYVESHDNNTLLDKLKLSLDARDKNSIDSYHRLSSSIPLLAQGLPFIHAGQEFQRTKDGDPNSYKSSDQINSLKWDLVATNALSRDYFKGLLSLRAAHPAFRIDSAKKVKANLTFIKSPDDVIAYSLNGKSLGDSWKSIVVIHNAGKGVNKISLPSRSNWNVVVEGEKAGIKILRTIKSAAMVEVPALTTMVLYTR